jgi:hypothetical protein
MSRPFLSTTRYRPCPVCSDMQGDCRITSLGNVLCHSYILGENIGEWQFIKPIQDIWGLFVPASTYNLRGDSFEAISRHIERDRKKDDARQLQHALSAKQLEDAFRRCGRASGLDAPHRENLISRGFSDEELSRYGFFSVAPNQDVVAAVPWAFPGVKNARRFSVASSGFTVPFFNREGQIHGYQIRLDKVEASKYRWAKGELSSHIAIGGTLELPLTFIDGGSTNRKRVGLGEGGLKVMLAAKRIPIPFIGASGGHFDNSPKQLASMLDGAEEAVIFPDGGDVLNLAVMRRWERQIDYLSRQGYTVKVAWWGQVQKGGTDIDEVPDATLQQLAYLDPAQFYDIARKEQRRATTIAVQKRLHSLSATPTLRLAERYLPNLSSLVRLEGIVALHSPKGTGKTVQIKGIKEMAEARGMKVIFPTPRRALGREQAAKCEFEWAGDLLFAGVSHQAALENIAALGLCWDSFWKLQERDFHNTLVVIDEAELAISHLMLSATCKEKRPQILRTLETKLAELLLGGGCLLIADADLSDISLRYFSTLAPTTPLQLIVNEPEGSVPTWNVEFWRGKKDMLHEQLLSQLQEPVMEADGTVRPRRIAIATDSQSEAEAIERAIRQAQPDINMIRIDSTTTETDFGRNFVERPNESITSLQPQVLIYTPSMGAGVSIDGSWFDEVNGFFFGAVEPSQARQMLGRNRQPIPRYVWCRERGILDGEALFLPHEIKEKLFCFHKETSILLDVARAIAGDGATDSHLMGVYAQIWDANTKTWDNPHLDCYSDLMARKNFALAHLAEQLLQELREEGHQVVEKSTNKRTEQGQLIAQIKGVLPVEVAMAISRAADIPLDVALLLNQRPNPTEEQRHEIAKAFLRSELPGIELTPEFIYKAVTADRRHWLNAVRLYWYCQHPKEAAARDTQIWLSQLAKFASGAVYLPDVRTVTLQVSVLRQVGLFEAIDTVKGEKIYSEDSPEIQRVYTQARRLYHKLRLAFGITVTKKTSPIFAINRLLERVGLRLKCCGEDKNRKRLYQVDLALLTDSDRIAVLESLSRRAAQIQAERALEAPAPFADSINNAQLCGEMDESQDRTALPSVAGDLVTAIEGAKGEELKGLLQHATELVRTAVVSGSALWERLSERIKEVAREVFPKEFQAFAEAVAWGM